MEDAVRLAVPATPEYLRLGRVTASGLASRLGFTYDEIDDLRLAIDELCGALMTMGNGPGTVELAYKVHDDGLEIEGVGTFEQSTKSPKINEWSARILDALVDEHQLDDHSGPHFRLVKRRG